MQKVSYMGDGSTTEFTFNFPYFENTDVIVTKNGADATGYSIVGNSNGLNADIPYTGGKVVFETAPTSLDSITIARQLPLTRVVDYQPLSKIDPTELNKDANYLMEVIKDLKDELETLEIQYSDIADKESTTVLLARITEIHNEIVAASAQIEALGDVSTLLQTVTTNSENITTLDTRTTGLIDYVIASQAPTADNNYTWYRKYKSGWVEQGGTGASGNVAINLPITMADTNYTATMPGITAYSSTVGIGADAIVITKTTTTVKYGAMSAFGFSFDWYVCGFCA